MKIIRARQPIDELMLKRAARLEVMTCPICGNEVEFNIIGHDKGIFILRSERNGKQYYIGDCFNCGAVWESEEF